MNNDNYTTIAFTNPWDYMSQEEVYKAWLRCSPNETGVWKNIKLIQDPYSADWVIGWETLDPNLDLDKIDMSKVILIGREPPWMLALGSGYKYDNWDSFPNIKYKFKCALGNSHLFASWTSKISYDEMKEFSWKPRKKKLCIVMSNKRFCWGHGVRLDFIEKFCKKYPDVLDIYGNGAYEWCQQKGLESHYKGCSPYCFDDTKHRWISAYNYSLAFENGILDGYFTEKWNDVVMAYTMPIFWGARDINKYFPAKSFHYLDLTDEGNIDKLYEIIQEPPTEENIVALGESRRRIMDIWNEWPTIKRIIDTGNALPENIQENKQVKFTFGVCSTPGNEQRIKNILASIEKNKIPSATCEVVVVGNISPLGYSPIDVRIFPFDESKKSGWITKKKNIITEKAKFENIVYMHDYIVLEDGWYKAMCDYGNEWDLLMNRIINIDGSRYRDWVLVGSWTNNPFVERQSMKGLLPYEEKRLTKWMYFSGAYWIAKKKFMKEYPLNESLVACESEDVEWSYRVKEEAKFFLNEKAVVKINKDGKHAFLTNSDQAYIDKVYDLLVSENDTLPSMINNVLREEYFKNSDGP